MDAAAIRWKNKYRIPSTRLEKWDYAWNGLYFVTICTKDKIQFFGNINHTNIHLNEIGLMAEKYWLAIVEHFNFIQIHDFVVMPNHIHGILEIKHSFDQHPISRDVTNGRDVACYVSTAGKNEAMSNISPKKGSLSTVIRSYKSIVSKNAKNIDPHFAWQTRFYEHIIRDTKSYLQIANYIGDNPKNWQEDENYTLE